MNGVLGHNSALVRLYWAGDNLSKCDEFCYESCPWCRIDRSACWPAFQRATTVPRMPFIVIIISEFTINRAQEFLTRHTAHSTVVGQYTAYQDTTKKYTGYINSLDTVLLLYLKFS